MFGHNDDQNQDNTAPAEPMAADQTNISNDVTASTDATTDGISGLPGLSTDDTVSSPLGSDTSMEPTASEPALGLGNAPSNESSTPVSPSLDSAASDVAADDDSANDSPKEEAPSDNDYSSQDDDDTVASPADSTLVELKKKSLEELVPLVDKLDQTPDEKFRTTMMMLQATDDSSLLQKAHDAAANLPDEKDRAQALLDVVNEINYFMQSSSQGSDSDN